MDRNFVDPLLKPLSLFAQTTRLCEQLFRPDPCVAEKEDKQNRSSIIFFCIADRLSICYGPTSRILPTH